MSGLKDWFTALSRREQILIGILGALLALVVALFGVYWPLYNAATEAKIRHNEVTIQAGRLSAKLAALRDPAAKSRPTISGALNLLIASEAGERGFTLERNQPNSDDNVDISIGSARSTALLGWLADLESRGIIVDNLTTRRMENGSIAVTATLAKAGS